MTIYRVITGHGTNFYGYDNGQEEAKYFLNKEKAKAFYKTGEFTVKETRITTTLKNGQTVIGRRHAMYYEETKAKAEPNEKVELIEKTENYFRMEVIEIEE